jgi:hypothetical protein
LSGYAALNRILAQPGPPTADNAIAPETFTAIGWRCPSEAVLPAIAIGRRYASEAAELIGAAMTVLTVTAYEAFGQLHILATEVASTERGRSYRLVLNEPRESLRPEGDSLADVVSLVALALWDAADRLARTPF